MKATIVLLPGDGIGTEVVAEGRRVLEALAARHGTRFGKPLFSICPNALRSLEAFPWPGNIPQLDNVIQQAVLSSSGNELKVHHLSPPVQSGGQPRAPLPPGGHGGTLRQNRETAERANILRALERAGHSRTRAAQILGVSRVTLYKKMKKYGLQDRESGTPGTPGTPGAAAIDRRGLPFRPVPPAG